MIAHHYPAVDANVFILLYYVVFEEIDLVVVS